jgi:hypothetical protein
MLQRRKYGSLANIVKKPIKLIRISLRGRMNSK